MKKIILIPLLLSTFLLVGCEKETEFDRCFEANGGNAEFDYALYKEKVKSSFPEEDEPVENTLETIKEQRRIFESSLTAIELEFHSCASEKYADRMEELVGSGMKILDTADNIDIDEIENLCLSELESKNKNRAKEICHSQGVY